MAQELIQQILAPNNAPYVNGVRAGNKVSTALLENIYQGLVETNDRGITDRFATESEVNENAQIFVNRIRPVEMDPREQGASKNGGSFSNKEHYTQTVTVNIPLLITIDDPIIIPGARQRMIKTDLLAQQTNLYGQRLNTIINGATAASKLFATWNDDRLGKEVYKVDITAEDITNKTVLSKLYDANTLLDGGDIENGVDIFPENTRIAVFKVGARPILKANGVVIVGGSNYAQDIVAGKAVSQGATTKISENGYFGDIDGLPCHTISNESLRHADGFLGLPKGTLVASDFFGYVASSYANARGVSMVDQIKVVDTRGGQGVELQPFTKLGVATWYSKGNVIVTKDGAAKTLFARLADLFSGIGTGSIALKLKAAGSRLYPVIASLAADASDNQLKVTADAKDDAGVNHIVAGHFLVSPVKVKSVDEFLKGVDNGGENGAVNNFTGGATVCNCEAGNHVAVLLIADDGSLTLGDTVVVA